MESKYFSLREIEGVGGTHDSYLKRSVAERVDALAHVIDVDQLAEFIGGKRVVNPGLRCDWVIEKELFPGIKIFYLYSHPDDEFGASLQVLFSGDRLKLMKGEDLAVQAIAVLNHMLRYVRVSHTDKKLPPICSMV